MMYHAARLAGSMPHGCVYPLSTCDAKYNSQKYILRHMFTTDFLCYNLYNHKSGGQKNVKNS